MNGCPVGGAAAAEKISAIMGVEAGEFVKKVAFVKCAGTCEKASDKYQYSGVQSCIEAMNVPGAGPKGCEFGCMGFGSCAAVCPENAISIVNGIAHIDEEACVGCGKCAETCPKALIDLVPENKKTRADKRLDLRCQFITDQKTTCSLWPSESLVTCKCQCVYVTFLHINVNGSCRLCSVQNKKKPMFFAEISDFLCRHDSSAYYWK